MHSKQQSRNSLSRGISGVAMAALAIAIVFALTVVVSRPAQAQTFTVLYSFDPSQPSNGRFPRGLTMDKAGNLYGTTENGGQSGECNGDYIGCGAVFKLSNQGSRWAFASLYKFTGYEHSDGALPLSGIVLGSDGSLYGTTVYGGTEAERLCRSTGCGTVYKLTPPRSPLEEWTETVLYRFGNGSSVWDGAWPVGPPVFDGTGNLYATTLRWAAQDPTGPGTVFELISSGGDWRERILWGFRSPGDGGNPNALIFDNAGNLYSTTGGGGAYSCGTVFRLTPSGSGWTENILYTFQCGSDGGFPLGNLVFDRSGNLYGGTGYAGSGGGGTIFELSPSGSSWIFKVLYSFTGFYGTEGCCDLAMDASGNLYGANFYGDSGSGTIFQLTPSDNGWVYTSIHEFTGGDDGNNPTSLLLGADGNLYGTTYSGGAYGSGTVFEITP